jgi:hypothetical protein
MSEKKELKDIDIEKLFDEIEEEFKRQSPDERQANQEKFRLEHPELDKELEAIVSEFKTTQSTGCLSARSPKDVLLEILTKARNAGIAAITSDTTTFASDDQDCYPQGIILTIERNRPEWELLKRLGKEIPWISVDRQLRRLSISSGLEISFRLTLFAYQSVVADTLNANGISCYADVHWRG